jgi:uncharacterized membrane protein (DUF106 family)
MVEHPFIDKKALDSKSMEELQEAIQSLTTKLNYAYRMGNGALISQLQMVLETYKSSHRKKMDAIFEKQKLNTKINIQSENDNKN